MFGQDKPDVYGVLNVGSVSHQTRVVKNSQEAAFSEVMNGFNLSSKPFFDVGIIQN